MNKRVQLIAHLADGEYHSGARLAEQLSISRTAIWKRIQSLQRRGMAVDTVRGKGYRLTQPVELLDREQLLMLLDDDIKNLVKVLTLHTEIKSTNQYLLDRINRPDFHGHVALAEFQSAGRGRRGRHWHAPFAAGICFSLGWHFDPAPQSLAMISLGAGVAIIRALCRIGIRDAGLKWPNDVYWRGRKLGGILVEAREESAGPCSLVVGIGINFCFPAAQDRYIDQPWVDIATILQPLCSRHVLAAALISEIMRLSGQVAAMNYSGIIDAWRRHDHMRGKKARLILPAKTVEGRIAGIDHNGALLMEVRGKVERFNTGEITLRVRS